MSVRRALKKFFSACQIAALAASERSSELFKHFIILHCAASLRYKIFATLRDIVLTENSDDKTLATQKKGARIRSFKLQGPHLATPLVTGLLK
jgi:hypothetical protein